MKNRPVQVDIGGWLHTGPRIRAVVHFPEGMTVGEFANLLAKEYEHPALKEGQFTLCECHSGQRYFWPPETPCKKLTGIEIYGLRSMRSLEGTDYERMQWGSR